MKKLLSVILCAMLVFPALVSCAKKDAVSSAVSQASLPESQASVSQASVAAQPESQPVTILVAAAASLEKSFKEQLIPEFSAKYPWITVEGSYDSSGKLQTQIEEGLEADLFVSAATKQMNALAEGGFIEQASVTPLLENQIVLIVPANSEQNLASFKDIVQAETIAIGDTESVPAGQYAKEALTSLGIWDEVAAKASFGTNVTEVLNWVAEGSAGAGIVYSTDAAGNDKVKVVEAAPDGSLAEKIIYPAGITAAGKHKEEAKLFLDYLKSDAAMDIFTAQGFKPAA